METEKKFFTDLPLMKEWFFLQEIGRYVFKNIIFTYKSRYHSGEDSGVDTAKMHMINYLRDLSIFTKYRICIKTVPCYLYDRYVLFASVNKTDYSLHFLLGPYLKLVKYLVAIGT